MAMYSVLASTNTTNGASLIGVEDAGSKFVGDTVEEVLQEVGTQLSGGVTGTFTSADGKTVTVTNGIITSIV